MAVVALPGVAHAAAAGADRVWGAIGDRLLAYSPDDRFPSAEEAAEALAACAVSARKKSPARRHLMMGASALLLMMLLAAGAWFGLGNRFAPVAGPGKEKVLFLLPTRGLWYEDYFPSRQALEKAGFDVAVATPGGKPSVFCCKAWTNLNATPTPARSINGYLWSLRFGLIVEIAGGITSVTLWGSGVIT